MSEGGKWTEWIMEGQQRPSTEAQDSNRPHRKVILSNTNINLANIEISFTG